jgi:molybdate transport system permease protein
MDWQALAVSIRLAFWTTLFVCLIGVPLAYWHTRASGRWKSVLDAFITLPLVVPPTVFGLALLLLLGAQGPLGSLGLAFSFPGIVLASVLINLPVALRPFCAAFALVEPRFLEASWCLGVSHTQTMWRVARPLAMPGLLAGTALTFAHTLGEFGVVLMVGGNQPGVTRTLSLAIYDDVQALDYTAALGSAAVLVGIAFLVVWLVQMWLAPRHRP